MELPNRFASYVPVEKITEYLLSEFSYEMIRELDTVVLSHDLKEYALTHGDVGAVVHCNTDDKAFEVEFVTGEGKTIAVVTLSKSDIRPMQGEEILHVCTFEMA